MGAQSITTNDIIKIFSMKSLVEVELTFVPVISVTVVVKVCCPVFAGTSFVTA